MQRRRHLLAQQRLGIVVHPHAAFFQHHIALGRDAVVGQIQIGHAVGFQIHRQLEPVGGDLLIESGKSWVVKAFSSPPFLAMVWAILVARHLLGAAEHHMLEEMRQARNAGRIVHPAHLEPHHLGHHRGAVIGDHQHLHAVLQRELENLGRGGMRGLWMCVGAAGAARKDAGAPSASAISAPLARILE